MSRDTIKTRLKRLRKRKEKGVTFSTRLNRVKKSKKKLNKKSKR